jgi:malonyl-CoA O-methyltransferase
MTFQATDRVQRSFSRSFHSYHGEASQQARVADQLVTALGAAGAPERFSKTFELGCGTGHLTRRLMEAFDCGALTLNDLTPAAAETANSHRATFLCGDASKVSWPTQPDLIASASMIQWLQNPAEFLRQAANALSPGGWLAISGFGPHQYTELAQIGSSAAAPGLLDHLDMASAVTECLEVINTGEALERVFFATPRDVLQHLRKTGVNGRAQKPWTKATLRQFSDDYERLHRTAEGVSLTYHATWIVARKAR